MPKVTSNKNSPVKGGPIQSEPVYQLTADDIQYIKWLQSENKYSKYDPIKHDDPSMLDPRDYSQND